MLLDRDRCQLLLVDMQERLAPAVAGIAEVESRCALLLATARECGVPVIVSEQYPKGLGRTLASLQGSIENYQVFEKMEFSCYANPRLRAALTAVPRRQTIICGIEAHVCVLQTALEMKSAGAEVFLVADATSSRREGSREMAFGRAARAGVELVDSEMVFFEWLRSAAAPEFRFVSRLIR